MPVFGLFAEAPHSATLSRALISFSRQNQYNANANHARPTTQRIYPRVSQLNSFAANNPLRFPAPNFNYTLFKNSAVSARDAFAATPTPARTRIDPAAQKYWQMLIKSGGMQNSWGGGRQRGRFWRQHSDPVIQVRSRLPACIFNFNNVPATTHIIILPCSTIFATHTHLSLADCKLIYYYILYASASRMRIKEFRAGLTRINNSRVRRFSLRKKCAGSALCARN